MPYLKSPKFSIKNLILLVVLLIVSSLISLVGRLIVNKTQSPTVPTAQAQSCWTPSGGGCTGSEGSEGGGGSGEGSSECCNGSGSEASGW